MIRKADVSDLEAVHEIEEKAYSRPWSLKSFSAELEKDFSNFYVYELDGIVIGYVIIWHILDEAEIANIAIHNDYRGRGLGRKLLTFALETASFAKAVYLEVDVFNESAIELYHSAGFAVVGIIANYYGQGQDAYLMKLEVERGVEYA